MSSIMELLSGSLDENRLQQMSKALGADPAQTKNAIGAALPALLGAVARQAGDKDGAKKLHAALERDHDGSLLDNLGGYLEAGGKAAGPRDRSYAGDAIVNHMLGDRKARVEQGVGQIAGLDSSAAGKLLSMLAPILMGALGKQQRGRGMSADDLSGYLQKERSSIEQQARTKSGGFIGRLLDQDGDGDFDLKDALSLGARFLFNKKK